MRSQHSLLGQVFLRDKKYIKKILDHLDIRNKKVLEIGPGKGALTEFLVKKADQLYCVEFDSSFCNFLADKFCKKSNMQVIHADILNFPIASLGRNITVFGNVPYKISSKLIDYLIKNKNYIKKVYLTVQKEFAEKLLARPKRSCYSLISCYIQYHAKVKKIFDLPAGAFLPHPKVCSSFIEIEFHNKLPLKVKDEKFLFKIIRRSFQQRRKKLINSLKEPLTNETRKKKLYNLGIKLSKRPSDLSLKDYCVIADCLSR